MKPLTEARGNKSRGCSDRASDSNSGFVRYLGSQKRSAGSRLGGYYALGVNRGGSLSSARESKLRIIAQEGTTVCNSPYAERLAGAVLQREIAALDSELRNTVIPMLARNELRNLGIVSANRASRSSVTIRKSVDRKRSGAVSVSRHRDGLRTAELSDRDFNDRLTDYAAALFVRSKVCLDKEVKLVGNDIRRNFDVLAIAITVEIGHANHRALSYTGNSRNIYARASAYAVRNGVVVLNSRIGGRAINRKGRLGSSNGITRRNREGFLKDEVAAHAKVSTRVVCKIIKHPLSVLKRQRESSGVIINVKELVAFATANVSVARANFYAGVEFGFGSENKLTVLVSKYIANTHKKEILHLLFSF